MADFNVIFTLSETEPIIASFVQSEEQSIKAIFKIDIQITKLSQLINDANYVQDADYVHTDNNFTDTEQTKLSGIADGAQVNVIEIVKKNGVALTVTDKTVDVSVPTALSELSDDSTHRLVTDTEKSTWNGKQNALGFTPENVANKVTSFQSTPDDTHYASEKLVKDSLDSKVPYTGATGDVNLGAYDLTTTGSINTGSITIQSADIEAAKIMNTDPNSYSRILYDGNVNDWSSGVGNSNATIADLRNKYYVYDFTNSKIAFTILPNTLAAQFYGSLSAANLSGTNTGDQDISGLLQKSGDSMTGHLAYTTPQVINCAFVDTEPDVGDMVEGCVYFVVEDI